jgi:hypothetical protein
MREVNYDERWKVARDLACKINLWPTVENLRHLDAALRRAKAEGLELAARELCMYCNDPGNWAPMSNSGYHQCNTPGPNMTRCGATKIHALRRELDARAAQIEAEG